MDAGTRNKPRQAPTVDVADLQIMGYLTSLPALLYRPDASDGPLPVVLYLHGGGFVSGSLDDADATARQLVAQAGVAVLSLDYSLAPHHPFPAAPEDAYAALNWLTRNASNLGLDVKSVAEAGDDAGGNIAALTALISRNRNGPKLAAQILIGPMLAPSMTLLGDPERLGSGLKPQICAQRYAL